jgi:hypothetical protein
LVPFACILQRIEEFPALTKFSRRRYELGTLLWEGGFPLDGQ